MQVYTAKGGGIAMGTCVFNQHRHPESQTLLLPLRLGASGVSQACQKPVCVCVWRTPAKGQPA